MIVKQFKVLLLLSTTLSQFSSSLSIDLVENCGEIHPTLHDDEVAPWVAGIFWRQRSFTQPFRYMVSGAIIGNSTVISVWGGGYGSSLKNSKYKIPLPKFIVVGAGLDTASLNLANNKTQIREVEYILPYGDEDPNNNEFHLVIIRLKSPFDFTGHHVKPICWPTEKLALVNSPNINQQSTNYNYIATGFPYSSFNSRSSSINSQLIFQSMSIDKKQDCDNSFRYYYKGKNGDHVLCARPKINVARTDLNAFCVSHGSSLVIPHEGKYYLGGLVALIPSKSKINQKCSTNTLYFFTNFLQVTFSPFNQWLERQIVCNHDEFPCPYQDCIPVSKVCNKIKDCTFSELGDGDEDDLFCEATNHCGGIKSYYCGLNDHCIEPKQVCDGKIHCLNGMDESETICTSSFINNRHFQDTKNMSSHPIEQIDSQQCQKNCSVTFDSSVKCKMLQYAEGVHQVCMDKNDMTVSCENSVPGTKMILHCKPYYESKFRLAVMKMTCGVNGRWTPFRPFSCEAICGSISVDNTPGFIAHGEETSDLLAFPFYAAMFLFNENLKIYEFICGSSLIETSIIITAAHCVSEGNSIRAHQNLRIVLGPISSNFEENVMNNSTTIIGINGIWIAPTYSHVTLTSDIALLRLDRNVEYSARIRPLCYLSKIHGANLIPKIDSIGKVAGFGKDETGKISHRLKFATFPVHSREFCAESLRTYIAENEFCSGFQNGSVCIGDSGGGLVFPFEVNSRTVYVLKGIVSRGKLTTEGKCDVTSSAVFTHPDSFSDWIYDVLEHIGVS